MTKRIHDIGKLPPLGEIREREEDSAHGRHYGIQMIHSFFGAGVLVDLSRS